MVYKTPLLFCQSTGRKQHASKPQPTSPVKTSLSTLTPRRHRLNHDAARIAFLFI